MELNNRRLVRTSPERQGVSSARVLEALKALDSNENEVHGVMIARNNCVISESWPRPYEAAFPHTNHSMGKSYTCTAVGIACTEGLLDPEDKMVDLLSEEIGRYGVEVSPLFKRMRLRDVMAMAGGMTSMPMFDDCWLENFLRHPVEKEPGTWFCYNSIGSCLLGAIVEKVAGCSLYDYLRRKLFDRIGIGEGDLVWQKFGSGIYAEPGVSATTEANLRLGLFYLAQGRADGEQIVSREWMQQATSHQVNTDNQPGEADLQKGYGWQLWMCSKPGAFRFDGGQGQYCVVDPATRTVIAVHEGGMHPTGVQKTLDILERLLCDMGDDALPEDPEALDALRRFELSRSLPQPETAPIPAGATRFNGTYVVREGHANFWMEAFPDNVEFYHMFYDPYVARDIQFLSLKLENGAVRMAVNERSVFRVRLDGVMEACETLQVLPHLPMTCATGHFSDENTLRIRLRWLNSWVAYDITLRLEGLNLAISVSKGMRHEGKPPVIQNAVARRIG